MTKGINVRQFNESYAAGTARFRRFHGAKAFLVKHYMGIHLLDETPEVVLFHVGGNDLPTKKNDPTSIESIANTIIEAGQKCIDCGVEKVLISGVITRKVFYQDKRRHALNILLKSMCDANGFFFIDNENITQDYLFNDGVHLETHGSMLFKNNLLNALNNLF